MFYLLKGDYSLTCCRARAVRCMTHGLAGLQVKGLELGCMVEGLGCQAGFKSKMPPLSLEKRIHRKHMRTSRKP